jgi:predicted nucleic acid-binding protein
MSTLLLDASVWIASLDPKDRHSAAAQELIDSVEKGASLAALDLTLYEVADIAVRRWRAPDDARTLVQLVQESCPSRITAVDGELAMRAIAQADRHGLSVYDASYVAAADLQDWTLVSIDHKDLIEPGLAITPEAALAA